MDPASVLLIGGGVALALIYFSQQQQSLSAFSSFMEASGASESDISSSIVPVSDTDVSQQSNSSSAGGVATIQDFAQAIFGFEGGKPGDLNVRNNNPGNLKAAPDQFTGIPTVRDSNGFVIFSSMDLGMAALNTKLSETVNDMPSLTLTQFFARYLGQSDYLSPKVTSQGDPFAYANKVASQLGTSADQTLGQIFGGG